MQGAENPSLNILFANHEVPVLEKILKAAAREICDAYMRGEKADDAMVTLIGTLYEEIDDWVAHSS